MTDETAFLQSMLDEPNNDVLRLVYADWLEEQGDPIATKKAEFLRLTVQGPDFPSEVPEPLAHSLAVRRVARFFRNKVRLLLPDKEEQERKLRQKRLRELSAALDPEWLAVTSHLPVENCPTERTKTQDRNLAPPPFQFVCDRRWEDLQATEEEKVRFCEGCQQRVHYCSTESDVKIQARFGNCVAVNLGIIRRDRDLEPEMEMLMGMLTSDYFRENEE